MLTTQTPGSFTASQDCGHQYLCGVYVFPISKPRTPIIQHEATRCIAPKTGSFPRWRTAHARIACVSFRHGVSPRPRLVVLPVSVGKSWSLPRWSGRPAWRCEGSESHFSGSPSRTCAGGRSRQTARNESQPRPRLRETQRPDILPTLLAPRRQPGRHRRGEDSISLETYAGWRCL
jgi:hypothetical protein